MTPPAEILILSQRANLSRLDDRIPLRSTQSRVEGENTMFRAHHFIASCSFIIGLGTATATAAAAEMRSTPSNRDVVEITELQPFTHLAYIPAGSSTSSIKIEDVKLVKVATIRRSVTNERNCNQSFVEPGGSMYCQHTADESPVFAYRVTYSYRGQPMVSDEYGNTYFTFGVYFRPEEISPRLREMLASGKLRRNAIAEFFELTTSRESVMQTVIDEARSSFCDGNYVDGNWVLTHPRCEDKVVYTKVASPSAYVTVRVAPARLEAAAASGLWPE
jgi:hypothetical protein